MLVKISPFTRINDLVLWSEHVTKIKQQSHNVNVYHDGGANNTTTHHQFLDIQKGFLYVCTETVFNYPHAYLSEKAYKGITAKRPFVIVGAPNSLALLQEYGFKTFNSWWNEGYDIEQDPSRRIEKIHAIIKDICAKSNNEIKTMCTEMTPVLEYNFQHYTSFSNSQISDFEKECSKNLRMLP